MRKVFILFSLLVLGQLAATAHEFWLQAKKYRFAISEEVAFDFLVGENFEGEPWDLKPEKIDRIEWHAASGSQKINNLLRFSEPEKLKLKFSKEGTNLIYFQSKDAFIELEGEKFNAYLKEDGLDDIYDQRKKTNTLNKPAREHYGRYAKILVQCGTSTDDTFKKKVGTRLEIIPLQYPYTLTTGDYLACQILFDGKPSPHQMVKVWNKIPSRTFLQNIYTEKDGTIRFPINAKGP